MASLRFVALASLPLGMVWVPKCSRALLAVWMFVPFAAAEAASEESWIGCPLEPGRSSLTLRVGSRNRRVVVEVGPQAGKKSPAPVVFFWHGWGGDPRGHLDWLGGRQAWPEAVFVAPEGLPRRFPGQGSLSLPGWQLRSGELGDRDLRLFDALVDRLSKLECLDRTRFVSSGFSNGGYFSNLLGCRRSSVLAAIAPVGSGGPYEACEAPVAVWIAHGSFDRVVSPQEGRASLARWEQQNDCQPVEPVSEGCTQALSCSRDLTFCDFRGGHTWPGNLTPRWRTFLEAQGQAKPQAQ